MLFTTLIPIRDNEGNEFPEEFIQEILEEFSETFVDNTIDGPTRGSWVDPVDKKVYRDECWRVRVSCERELLFEAQSLVRSIGERLNQTAMYFEVQYFDGIQILRMDENQPPEA